MTLTDEQAKGVKEQILKQVENFPEDKREQIREYINSMNNEELEEFIKKNNQMQQEAGEGAEEGEKKCIMCLLANKKIESVGIYEDKEYNAVLDINPVSNGQTLLIPKEHITEVKKLKTNAFSIAKKIGGQITKKLGAEDVQINSSDETGHAIVTIIPKYKGQAKYERKQAKKEELLEIAKKIGEIKKAEKKPRVKKEKAEVKVEEKKEHKKDILKFSRRIP